MSEMEKTVETGTDEFEALLPEGWAEGDDIFDEGSWSGSASAEDPDQEDSSEETNTDPTDPAPTTEPEADESGAADDASASSAKKFRVPVKINHESSEVEISEADLPALYQKAMAFDRGQEKSTKTANLWLMKPAILLPKSFAPVWLKQTWTRQVLNKTLDSTGARK